MQFNRNGYKISYSGIEILDRITVSVSDSWVKDNKLDSTRGNGEARLFVGTKESSLPFFGEEFLKGTNVYQGFILKADLVNYLNSAYTEYHEPENYYRKQDTMIERYKKYLEKIDTLDDVNYFYVKIHNDNGEYGEIQNRIYIDGCVSDDVSEFTQRNRSEIYNFLRLILLPIISKIILIKVEDTDLAVKEELIWFIPYIHEIERVKLPANVTGEVRRIQEDSTLNRTQKYNLVAARVGQGKFRESLMDRFKSECVITQSNQIEILEASHIKPWVYSNDDEKLNKNNGLLLSRNMHRLFDLGFITFDRNYNVVFSSLVTNRVKDDCKSLGPLAKRLLKDSENYLKYHRENIYREDIP